MEFMVGQSLGDPTAPSPERDEMRQARLAAIERRESKVGHAVVGGWMGWADDCDWQAGRRGKAVQSKVFASSPPLESRE